MSLQRMPRYDISNDGMGPYAIFYCDRGGTQLGAGVKFCPNCGTPSA